MQTAPNLELNCALHYKHEALREGSAKLTTRLEFCRILRKLRPKCWPHVHDSRTPFHPRQRCSHKAVRCQQKVIRLLRTARAAQIMHVVSASRIPPSPPVVPKDSTQPPRPWLCLQRPRSRPDRG